MAQKFYLRRGTLAELKTILLDEYELGFTTDTKQVFIGDGTANLPISVVLEGTLDKRPAAGNKGMVFVCTDDDAVYFDNGKAWIRPVLIDDASTSGTATWSSQKIAREIEAARAGLDQKDSVRVATTAPVDLTTGGLLEVDGVSLAAGDRVLVKDQEDPVQNGIYVAGEGAWERAADANGDPEGEVSTGMSCYVEEGTANGGSTWVMNSTGGVKTVGTDALTFTIGARLGELQAGDAIDINGDKVSVKIDGASIVLDEDGKLAVGTVDGGTFV